MSGRRALIVALAGAAIALALVPFTPAGVPVLVASVAALAGLTQSARDAAARDAARSES
jgi:predicted branched-subunit amino acid permease